MVATVSLVEGEQALEPVTPSDAARLATAPARGPGPDLVRLDGVSKSYQDGVRAVEDVSLAVGAGEFVAIMGPSGSGKSTLLNLIAGIERASSGRVVVAGMELGRLSESALARFRRRQVGFVFQSFHLLPNLPVLENVLVAGRLAGRHGSELEQRARSLLGDLGLADKAASFPESLSGGERQRAAIARALVNDAPLLLADEPVGSLDSRSGQHVMELLSALHRGGHAVILVTHDPQLANRYASRVIRLRDGRLVAEVSAGSALLFTDLVSSTALLEAIGDEAYRDLVVWLESDMRTLFAEHAGRVVNHTGDGFFALFATSADAIGCAVAIQRRLAEHRRRQGYAPQVRMGIHQGEVADAEGAIRGAAVHRAARLCAVAQGHGIVASREALGSAGWAFKNPRRVRFQGVPGDVEGPDVARSP